MRCSSAGAAPQATLNSLRTLLHPALARVHVAIASLAQTAFAYDDEALAYASLGVRRDAAGNAVPNQLPATAGEPQRCATWLARGRRWCRRSSTRSALSVVAHCDLGASRSPAVALA